MTAQTVVEHLLGKNINFLNAKLMQNILFHYIYKSRQWVWEEVSKWRRSVYLTTARPSVAHIHFLVVVDNLSHSTKRRVRGHACENLWKSYMQFDVFDNILFRCRDKTAFFSFYMHYSYFIGLMIKFIGHKISFRLWNFFNRSLNFEAK